MYTLFFLYDPSSFGFVTTLLFGFFLTNIYSDVFIRKKISKIYGYRLFELFMEWNYRYDPLDFSSLLACLEEGQVALGHA